MVVGSFERSNNQAQGTERIAQVEKSLGAVVGLTVDMMAAGTVDDFDGSVGSGVHKGSLDYCIVEGEDYQ